MKLLHTLPFLSLYIVSTLGEDHLRGLGELEPISGIQCDEFCMDEITTCQKKCDVDANDNVACKNGRLPKKCRKKCCDDVAGDKDDFSFVDLVSLRTVSGKTCNYTCMNSMARCRHNCEVDRSGNARCLRGVLPSRCEECCGDVDIDTQTGCCTQNDIDIIIINVINQIETHITNNFHIEINYNTIVNIVDSIVMLIDAKQDAEVGTVCNSKGCARPQDYSVDASKDDLVDAFKDVFEVSIGDAFKGAFDDLRRK